MIKNKFLKNLTILMSGSAIAQLLIVFSSPLLTRLYSPAQFGLFQLFTSITSILIVILTLKYEVAVVLPKNLKKTYNLIFLSFIISLVLSILFFLLIVLTKTSIANLLNEPSLTPWLMFIPLISLFIGLYKTLEYWNTKNSNFNKISVSKVNQSVSIITTQLFLGIIAFPLNGLILGQFMGRVVAFITLVYNFLKKDIKKMFKYTNYKRLLIVSKEYNVFPLYTAPQSLVNAFSNNSAPFILGAMFGSVVVGYYALALKFIKMPADLISESFKQVYLKRVSEKINNNERISRHLMKSTLLLGAIAFFPVLVVVIFAPSLFELVFGNEWREAGLYTRFIVIWIYFSFINKPSIAALQALKFQKMHFFFETISFLIRVATMIVMAMNYSALVAIAAYSLVSGLYNLLLIVYIRFIIKKNQSTGKVI